jgi:hypothetical protein
MNGIITMQENHSTEGYFMPILYKSNQYYLLELETISTLSVLILKLIF